MLIFFANQQTHVEAISLKLLTQKYGDKKARRMRQRLDELDAANNLDDLRTLPALHCQQVNDHPALLTICTVRPAGLLFEVEDLTCFDGKLLNWRKVTAIKIISLDEDTYE